MKPPRKTSVREDGTVPAMTRLKLLPAETRAELYRLSDQLKGAAWLEYVVREFDIPLTSESQLSDFRAWQLRQAVWDHFNRMVVTDEEALTAQNPDAPRERIREAAIKRAYAAADLAGDTRLALQVVDRDLRDSQDRRDWWAVQWQTAAKVLELIKSERAAQIADDDGDNSAKIEMLGQLMFGEDWKPQGKAES